MLLLTETDGLRLPVHLFDDSKRLQAIALLTQQATALLLAFLHGDADACHLATSLTYQVYEGMDGLNVGQEIVDQSTRVPFAISKNGMMIVTIYKYILLYYILLYIIIYNIRNGAPVNKTK